MKRCIAIFTCFLFLFALSACTAANPNETASGSTPGTAASESIDQSTESEYSPFRFLSDSNKAASIPSGSDEIAPPGTPLDVSCIPQPEQTPVGQQVRVALDAKRGSGHTVFYYQPENSRLVTIVWQEDSHFPLLMVFKAGLTDAGDLLEHIKSGAPFDAEILAMVNIDYQDGTVYAYNAADSQEDTEQWVVDTDNPGELTGSYYMGTCGQGGLSMKGADTGSADEAITNHRSVIMKIIERFSLDRFLFD